MTKATCGGEARDERSEDCDYDVPHALQGFLSIFFCLALKNVESKTTLRDGENRRLRVARTRTESQDQ